MEKQSLRKLVIVFSHLLSYTLGIEVTRRLCANLHKKKIHHNRLSCLDIAQEQTVSKERTNVLETPIQILRLCKALAVSLSNLPAYSRVISRHITTCVQPLFKTWRCLFFLIFLPLLLASVFAFLLF